MAVLVGIDEAGYGPLLGPLVVSSCAFSLPGEMLEKNLWQVLKKSVSPARRNLRGRLLITDSKKAHNKTDKIKHLERSALACFKCLSKDITTAGELIDEFCPDHLSRLIAYDWYREIETKKLISACPKDIEIAAGVFKSDMDRNSIRFLGFQGRCLDAGYYNQMVEKVQNKATVLFTAACELIKHALGTYGHDDLQIIVDHQSGKVRYGQNLLRMFPGMELKILKETPKTSSYQLTGPEKKMRIHFLVKADAKFLPVSLASMISKYLREILVEDINLYFQNRFSGLKPTAGYFKDGMRFLKDLEKFAAEGKIYQKELLVRSR